MGIRPLVLLVPSIAAAVELPRRIALAGRALVGVYAMRVRDLARVVAEPAVLGAGLRAWLPGHAPQMADRLLDQLRDPFRLGPDLPKAPVAAALGRTLMELRLARIPPAGSPRSRTGRKPARKTATGSAPWPSSTGGSRRRSRGGIPIAARSSPPPPSGCRGRPGCARRRCSSPATPSCGRRSGTSSPRSRASCPSACSTASVPRRSAPRRWRPGRRTPAWPRCAPRRRRWRPLFDERALPEGLRRLRGRLFEPPEGEPVRDGSVELLTASSEAAEVRTVVRRLLREADRGVAFEDMGVIVPRPEPYAPPVHRPARPDRGALPAASLAAPAQRPLCALAAAPAPLPRPRRARGDGVPHVRSAQGRGPARRGRAAAPRGLGRGQPAGRRDRGIRAVAARPPRARRDGAPGSAGRGRRAARPVRAPGPRRGDAAAAGRAPQPDARTALGQRVVAGMVAAPALGARRVDRAGAGPREAAGGPRRAGGPRVAGDDRGARGRRGRPGVAARRGALPRGRAADGRDPRRRPRRGGGAAVPRRRGGRPGRRRLSRPRCDRTPSCSTRSARRSTAASAPRRPWRRRRRRAAPASSRCSTTTRSRRRRRPGRFLPARSVAPHDAGPPGPGTAAVPPRAGTGDGAADPVVPAGRRAQRPRAPAVAVFRRRRLRARRPAARRDGAHGRGGRRRPRGPRPRLRGGRLRARSRARAARGQRSGDRDRGRRALLQGLPARRARPLDARPHVVRRPRGPRLARDRPPPGPGHRALARLGQQPRQLRALRLPVPAAQRARPRARGGARGAAVARPPRAGPALPRGRPALPVRAAGRRPPARARRRAGARAAPRTRAGARGPRDRGHPAPPPPLVADALAHVRGAAPALAGPGGGHGRPLDAHALRAAVRDPAGAARGRAHRHAAARHRPRRGGEPARGRPDRPHRHAGRRLAGAPRLQDGPRAARRRGRVPRRPGAADPLLRDGDAHVVPGEPRGRGVPRLRQRRAPRRLRPRRRHRRRVQEPAAGHAPADRRRRVRAGAVVVQVVRFRGGVRAAAAAGDPAGPASANDPRVLRYLRLRDYR